MPYEWIARTSEQTDTSAELHLWPFRSLPKKGFVWFVGGTCAFLGLPLVAVLGSAVLWGLLPFLVIATCGLWAALNRNYRDGEILETLVIRPDEMHLTRHNPRSPKQEWQGNPYWVRVVRHEKGGPVPEYLTLQGSGREVEIGSFLTPEERLSLYAELNDAIQQTR